MRKYIIITAWGQQIVEAEDITIATDNAVGDYGEDNVFAVILMPKED